MPYLIQQIEVDIAVERRDHAPYTKGNVDRLMLRSRRFVAEPKESECCDEW
jgi:hypothetical protein